MNRTEEIFKKLLKKLELDKEITFCEKFKIKPNTLSTWKKRDKIPYDLLENISQSENISLDWLLFDKADEKKSLPAIKEDDEGEGEVIEVNVYHNILASAGMGNYALENEPTHTTFFDKEFLKHSFGVKNFKELDFIKVSGHSMSPTIQDGDFVLVEKSPPRNGDMIIALYDGDIYVKRLYKNPPNGVILKSDNSNYKPLDIPQDKMENLHIIGVARIRIEKF